MTATTSRSRRHPDRGPRSTPVPAMDAERSASSPVQPNLAGALSGAGEIRDPCMRRRPTAAAGRLRVGVAHLGDLVVGDLVHPPLVRTVDALHLDADGGGVDTCHATLPARPVGVHPVTGWVRAVRRSRCGSGLRNARSADIKHCSDFGGTNV